MKRNLGAAALIIITICLLICAAVYNREPVSQYRNELDGNITGITKADSIDNLFLMYNK